MHSETATNNATVIGRSQQRVSSERHRRQLCYGSTVSAALVKVDGLLPRSAVTLCNK
jgi:hypothetical protein